MHSSTLKLPATPEAELNMLANAYQFILRCGEERRAQERKKGGPETAPEDGTKIKEDSANAPIIPD